MGTNGIPVEGTGALPGVRDHSSQPRIAVQRPQRDVAHAGLQGISISEKTRGRSSPVMETLGNSDHHENPPGHKETGGAGQRSASPGESRRVETVLEDTGHNLKSFLKTIPDSDAKVKAV